VKWAVTIDRQALKQLPRLPKTARKALVSLLTELETHGPVRGNWSNYGSLSGHRYHCHIKKGQPTYVAVWKTIDKERRIIEVIYVGTHEKAPY
jgi:mRNA-degrading endonuclease RelE of RelBE toxin-antitoxin system